MDVLDDHHERASLRHALEHPANGPERLLGLRRCVGQADRAQHHLRHRLVPVEQLDHPLPRIGSADLADDLGAADGR